MIRAGTSTRVRFYVSITILLGLPYLVQEFVHKIDSMSIRTQNRTFLHNFVWDFHAKYIMQIKSFCDIKVYVLSS